MKISIGAPIYDRRETRAVLKALREKRLSQGKYVQAFEQAWARYLGRRFAIAVNSGSSANLLAIQTLKERFGWRDGEAVIVPALAFPTAVTPVLQAGLRPVFVDVDHNGNITLENIKKCVQRYRGPKIRGIVLVHSLGVPCRDAFRIRRWVRSRGLPILEDACESHGARIGSRRVGWFGNISTTSFYVAHNMTTGEGGMIATDDPKLAAICRSLREFGRRIDPRASRYVHLASGPRYDIRYAFDRLGYNLRMTDLTASLGLVQLSKLEAMNKKRRRIVGWYRRELKNLIRQGFIVLPDEPRGTYNTYYTLLITFKTLPRRYPTLEKIALRLEAAGVETRPFMGGNLLRQKAFAGLDKPERFPMADFLHRRSLFVGCHPLLHRADVRQASRAIAQLYDK